MTLAPLTTTQHTRAVLRIGLPLIGGHMAQFAIGLTDTIMIGWYGVPELAGLTIATSLFFLLLFFGSGFAWAIMPMVATFAAKGEEVLIRRSTRMALWLSGLYSLAVMPILWFSAPLLLFAGQTEEVSYLAQEYLRIAGFALLPALAVVALKNYLAGLEHTRVVLWITLAAAGANVLANYALIFGNWGMPELGISGAAIASVVVQVVSLVLVIAYAQKVLPQHTLFVRFWKPDWEMFARVFSLGWPIGLTLLAEVSLFVGAAVLMGWLGTVPLAAHGVAIQIATGAFMIQMGLSNAATVRAGTALGHGDLGHLNDGARVVVALGVASALLSAAVFVLFPEALMGLFISPDEPAREAILAVGRVLLIMAGLFQLVDALQVIHVGLLRGLHDTRVPMVIAGLAYWGVGMPAALVFGFALGLGGVGVWLGLVVGLGVAAWLMIRRFWRLGGRLVVPVSTAA